MIISQVTTEVPHADRPDDLPDNSHALEVAQVEHAFDVELGRGLSSDQAAERLARFGLNELEARKPPSLWHLVWEAVSEPFIVLLLIAGCVAVALGETRDGLLVLIGLLPIVGADVITSYRGERALEALRETTTPTALVRRDGAVVQMRDIELVPGDVVLLAVGDVVPADLRVSMSDGLLIDRSVLTGESVPEVATTAPDAPDSALVERHAMAFSGTCVVQGRGEGIVVATGPASQLGRIASALGGGVRRRSPVQRELDRLVRILLTVALGLIAVTSGLALLRGEPLGVALLAGVAAAIAAIPEEPPVLLAVILGLGAYRLLRRNVLVRRLNAQETLSAVDLILTDKTGTLTQNTLTLEHIYTPAGEVADDGFRRLAMLGLRAQDDAWYRLRGGRAGSFTASLESALAVDGQPPVLEASELIEAEPASGSHPYTRTISRVNGRTQTLVLGAPEVVLSLTDDGAAADPWRTLVADHAGAGRRLLLLAGGYSDEPALPLGLLSFSDPLRPGVRDALAMAAEAGIQTVVVTGDHPLTAGRVAAAAGLPAGATVTGDEMSAWDEGRLERELHLLRLVARALPEHKLRIVEAARRTGRTVAVTGDGVNDAPALEHADVAVAMGSGAAVAREASDLVLGDDSFGTLMSGLREGRRMVANIQKGLVFLISTHVALLGFILVATLYGVSQPLLPLHILWLEIFIDISASIAFEREPEEPDLMRRPPRPRGVPLLTRDLLLRLTVAGSWTALGALVIIAVHPGGIDHARWVAFNALVFGQVVRAYANRSLTRPVLSLPPNFVLLGVGLVVLVTQLAIPFVPVLADAFHAAPLDAEDLIAIGIVALAPAALAEIVRATTHRTWVA